MFIIKTVVDAMVTILQRNQASKELFIAAVMGHLEVVLFLWIAGAGKIAPLLLDQTLWTSMSPLPSTQLARQHTRERCDHRSEGRQHRRVASVRRLQALCSCAWLAARRASNTRRSRDDLCTILKPWAFPWKRRIRPIAARSSTSNP